MNDSINKLNHELDVFRTDGGIFDVPVTELDLNIGKRGRYLNPSCGIEHELFTVATIQRNYRGELVYRVIPDSDEYQFGRPAHPNEVYLFNGDDDDQR